MMMMMCYAFDFDVCDGFIDFRSRSCTPRTLYASCSRLVSSLHKQPHPTNILYLLTIIRLKQTKRLQSVSMSLAHIDFPLPLPHPNLHIPPAIYYPQIQTRTQQTIRWSSW